jgi:hypothetical protein
MTKEQWFSLKPGSVIRGKKSKRLRLVVNVNRFGAITIIRASGSGTTVYVTGDKYLFEPTGWKLKEDSLIFNHTS